MTITKRRALAIMITLIGALALCGPAGAVVGMLEGNHDFARLADEGFLKTVNGSLTLVSNPDGSAANRYAWSMADFLGAVFVGTVRSEGNDLRAQIHRYTPGAPGGAAGIWALVFTSPQGFFVAQDIGYRWMTVCTLGDGTPRLFVATLGSTRGRILYTANGTSWQQMSTTGLNRSWLGFRPLFCFQDANGKKLLLTSPVGVSGDTDVSPSPQMLANDTVSGTWRAYSPLRFGDPNVDSIFAAESVDTDGNGSLDTAFAVASNPVEGFSVWKTTGNCTYPCVPLWTKIAEKGIGRPIGEDGTVKNWGSAHLGRQGNYLYFGGGDSAGNRFTAELFRLDLVTGKIVLVIGEPRPLSEVEATSILNFDCPEVGAYDHDGDSGTATIQACLPIGGMGPGLGGGGLKYTGGEAFYFWRIQAHTDGRLYVGTLQGFQTSGQSTSGCDLWYTTDNGETWTAVTKNCFGYDYHGGVRTMVSTPVGLFVGTANFPGGGGPSGCAVFLGTCDPALAGPPVSDPKAKLKSTPGQVVFDSVNNRYIAYDDENAPAPGNGTVSVTLEGSSSNDPFCGDIVEYRWDKGDVTGTCPAETPGAMGTPANGNLAAITLCSSSANVANCPNFDTLAEGLTASTADYNDYTFTLQVKDNNDNRTCKTVVVRASKNLPPAVTVVTDPPAVFSLGRWRVSLVDFDGNGSETLTLRGMCIDADGPAPLSCNWSATAGVTGLPGADGNPSILDPLYTATVPVGQGFGGGSDIFLTGIDNLSNQNSVRISVNVRTIADDTTQNDDPECEGTSRTTAMDTPLTINPASPLLCADPENDAILYTPTQPAAGTGVVNGGSNAAAALLDYNPPAGFTGEALFSFHACETSTPELECSDEVGVRVTVGGAPTTTTTTTTTTTSTTITTTTTTTTTTTSLPPPGGTPPAPTNVMATLTGVTRQVKVDWTDTVNETSYQVQRCRLFGSFCSFSNVTGSPFPANTSSINNTVSFAGTYRFQVRACNGSQCSAYVTSNNIAVP